MNDPSVVNVFEWTGNLRQLEFQSLKQGIQSMCDQKY